MTGTLIPFQGKTPSREELRTKPYRDVMAWAGRSRTRLEQIAEARNYQRGWVHHVLMNPPKKPRGKFHLPPKPTIYFAGKISSGDNWRRRILANTEVEFPPNLGVGREYNYVVRNSTFWDPQYRLDFGDFYYGGPYWVKCESHDYREQWQKVWDVNTARIKQADVMFAYIGSPDCFGTMVEIGVASQLNKIILMGFCDFHISRAEFADLWMMRMPASMVYRGTAFETWQRAAADLGFVEEVEEVEEENA